MLAFRLCGWGLQKVHRQEYRQLFSILPPKAISEPPVRMFNGWPRIVDIPGAICLASWGRHNSGLYNVNPLIAEHETYKYLLRQAISDCRNPTTDSIFSRDLSCSWKCFFFVAFIYQPIQLIWDVNLLSGKGIVLSVWANFQYNHRCFHKFVFVVAKKRFLYCSLIIDIDAVPGHNWFTGLCQYVLAIFQQY